MERESGLNDYYDDNYNDDNQQIKNNVITSAVFHTLSHPLWQTLMISQANNWLGFLMLKKDGSLSTKYSWPSICILFFLRGTWFLFFSSFELSVGGYHMSSTLKPSNCFN